MGYKTKSMIKQLSGLSVNYYLDKELNKYTDKISEPTKQGESIAKSTEKSTTSNLLKKTQLKKDFSLNKADRKQVRKAGREAARNTEVDFVKATPMGSDYFSLMAATAENLASRGAGKRKAKRAAKSLKRDQIRISNITGDKPTESKGFKEIQSKKTTPSSSKAEAVGPKKTDKFKTLPTTPSDPSVMPKIEEKLDKLTSKKVFEKQVKPMYNEQYGPLAPKNTGADINKAFGQKIYKATVKAGENARRILTPEAGEEMVKTQRDMLTAGYSQAEINKYAEEFRNKRTFAENLLRTGTNYPSTVSKAEADKFDANLKKAQDEKKKASEAKKAQDVEDAKERLGLNMTGDGFNKGMLRKNKYKK